MEERSIGGDFRTEKLIEKAKAEILFRQELGNISYGNANAGDFIRFLFGTVFLGACFAWASSSKESNFESRIFGIVGTEAKRDTPFVVFLTFTIVIGFFIYSYIKIRQVKQELKKIKTDFSTAEVIIKGVYYKFLATKLPKQDFGFDKEKMKEFNENAQDIVFKQDEFEDYLKKKYKKLKVSHSFWIHFATYVLLNEYLKRTLIINADGSYTFVVKDNPEFSRVLVETKVA